MKLSLTIAAATLALGLATPSFAAPAFNHGPSHFPTAKVQPAAFKPAPFARPQQWQLVGQRVVNQRATKDTIPVAGQARHQQIMVCAYNKPIRLSDLDVRFANGGKQDVAVRNVLQPGSCTRAIDLNGQKRDIRAVSLAYNSIGFGRAAALVKVFAR